MEKKAEDTERVENKVENELKIKGRKRERTDKKENPRGKKKEQHMSDLCKKEHQQMKSN